MELVVYSVPVAALIVGIVEVVKRSTGLEARWAAPLALALGVAFAVAARLDQPQAATWLQSVLLGLLTGLSASGMYSGTRAVARGQQ